MRAAQTVVAPSMPVLRRDAAANQERVLASAVGTLLRHGRAVPMATIAAQAGVGVATLYRRYATREALLDALTERSFSLVLAAAEQAAAEAGTGLEGLEVFLERTIEHGHQLVLPLHGGPQQLSTAAQDLRRAVHQALGQLVHRGTDDGTIRAAVSTQDVVMFGALLAQPLTGVADWTAVARRQKEIFLLGVAGPCAR